MLSFDAQMEMVRAWGDIALGCMTTAAQISTAMLGQSEVGVSSTKPAHIAQPPSCTRETVSTGSSKASAGASWYRAPESSPFDAIGYGMAWPFPIAVPALPFAAPQLLQPFQAWTELLQIPAMPAAFAMPSNPLSWVSPAAWPLPTLPWMAGMNSAALAPSIAAPANTAPFATYRSASGHAVAQFTFPNEVVAAVALPSSATSLLDTFFTWPRGLQ